MEKTGGRCRGKGEGKVKKVGSGARRELALIYAACSVGFWIQDGIPFLSWRRRRRPGGGGVGEGGVGGFWRVVGSSDSDRALGLCFCFAVFAGRKGAFFLGTWGQEFSFSVWPLARAIQPTAASQTYQKLCPFL